MEKGVSGYFDLPGSNATFNLRVNWSETYDTDTNKSIVKIDSVQIQSNGWYGYVYYPDGLIKINGVTAIAMNSIIATHQVHTNKLGGWYSILTNGGEVATGSVEVAHDGDGKKIVTIEVAGNNHEKCYFFTGGTGTEGGNGWNTAGSTAVSLTPIPIIAKITSVEDAILGEACSVKWTPWMASYRYKLHFSMGAWSYTTDIIHPNKTTEYTYRGYEISMEAAEAIPNATTGTMTVELYTYSDSEATVQIGVVDSATFTVTVPGNEETRPEVSMILTPVSGLPDAFAGMYIQGKTKLRAELTATGKYDATIKSISVKAENVTYDVQDSFISEYLATNGETTITGYATDSRGFIGSVSEVITVLPYIKPKILAASGESDVIIARCDAEGNLIESGTYLKIKAKRSYSLLKSDGVQHNHCKIQYRYKLASAESYSNWETILDGMSLASDEVDSEPLLGGVLSVKSTYMVEVRAMDDIGEIGHTMIFIPTDKVYMHRTKNALGLGKYAEGENLLDVGWDAHFHGEVRLGETGMTLKEYILAVISEGG